MRTVLAFFCLIFTVGATAETVKISGQDAQNICRVFRQIYASQQMGLANYPLAQIVTRTIFSSSDYEFSLGNADEFIVCKTDATRKMVDSSENDIVRVVYSSEVSSFETDRTYSGIQLLRAYNIQGALADLVCNQLETFNLVEDQASITLHDHILFPFKDLTVKNVFGLTPTLTANKYVMCGLIDGIKTLQFQSVGFFW